MTRVTESLSTQLPDTFDHARARVEDTFDVTRVREGEAAESTRK